MIRNSRYNLRGLVQQETLTICWPQRLTRNSARSLGHQLEPWDWNFGRKQKTSVKEWGDELLFENMLPHEKSERQLKSAVTAKSVIPVPEVAILEDNEYEPLYQVAYSVMPEHLIIEGEEEACPTRNTIEFQQQPVKDLTMPKYLPDVRVYKIDFHKILEESSTKNIGKIRFKILKDNNTKVTVMINTPNKGGKILCFPKR